MNLSAETRLGIETLKSEVIQAGGHLGTRRYHEALAGNISARVSGEDLVVYTRHGADVGALTPDDLLLANLNGELVEGKGRPTSEISMHCKAYAMRPEITSVVHAHPPTAMAFAAASVPLDQLQLPEMLVLLGPVALVPYATPGGEALAQRLAEFLPDHDAFLLENHGALSLGRSVRQAALRMVLIEQNAVVSLHVRQLGTPFALAAEERETLMGFRQRMEMWACHDAQEPDG
ncbi:MAG: class II aldolase/adducin family protein [bacterium]|nr:class II aldolase/adducin family protein [bacterium]